jgi:hypothetical protein
MTCSLCPIPLSLGAQSSDLGMSGLRKICRRTVHEKTKGGHWNRDRGVCVLVLNLDAQASESDFE